MRPHRSKIRIVTPFLAESNNGNWRTAQRWAERLSPAFSVEVDKSWDGQPCAALIVLHARRGAPVVRQWEALGRPCPLILCLTGTDLYSDLGKDESAQYSVNVADRLVVLQEDALIHLPTSQRSKTHVIYQSCKSLEPAHKPRGRLDCVMVGHIRAEKDPLTALRALLLLPKALPVRLLHAGNALDDALARELRQLAEHEPRYHWAGALPHGLARAAMKRAHHLIHPSTMEGGANAVMESITAGTSVLASRMSGNVGLLGKSYPGYFGVGDAQGLADLLKESLNNPNFQVRLGNASQARAYLFSPDEEKRRLLALVHEVIESH
jgi:putative glycosyltransferase (TIGR04348 family)